MDSFFFFFHKSVLKKRFAFVYNLSFRSETIEPRVFLQNVTSPYKCGLCWGLVPTLPTAPPRPSPPPRFHPFVLQRYLQEQTSQMDSGSLLLGFLDFYGNHFDPRLTGISVGRSRYFSRSAPLPPAPGPPPVGAVPGAPSSARVFYAQVRKKKREKKKHCCPRFFVYTRRSHNQGCGVKTKTKNKNKLLCSFIVCVYYGCCLRFLCLLTGVLGVCRCVSVCRCGRGRGRGRPTYFLDLFPSTLREVADPGSQDTTIYSTHS